MTDAEPGPALSDAQRRTLAAVLDAIIPPSRDGRLPGAGAIGLASHVEGVMRRTPELEALVAAGLAALDDLARRGGASDFLGLAAELRLEALRQSAATQPAFVPTLVFHAYTGYYHHERVLAALGLEPRPPHPKGHQVPESDFSLLDRVRRRGPLYRPV